MNVLQGLSRGDALSTQQPWFSQKLCCTQNHSFTDQPVLHKCPAPRPQLHALAGSAASLLSLDCTEEQGWFTPAPFPAYSALCSCLARWLNPNSSGRGGRRNTPKAVKYPTSDPDETWTWVHPVIPRPFLNVHFLHLSTAIMSAPLTRASIVSITI
jgi:hypothetical protein